MATLPNSSPEPDALAAAQTPPEYTRLVQELGELRNDIGRLIGEPANNLSEQISKILSTYDTIASISATNDARARENAAAIEALKKSFEALTPPLNQLRSLENQLKDEKTRGEISKAGAQATIAVLNSRIQQATADVADVKQRLASESSRRSVSDSQTIRDQSIEISTLQERLAAFSLLSSKVDSVIRIIDSDMNDISPFLKELTEKVQKVVTAVETLASRPAPQPQDIQLSADAIAKLEQIRAGIADIPAALRVPAQPNAAVDLTPVTSALTRLTEIVEKGGGLNSTNTGDATGAAGASFEEVQGSVNSELKKVIEQYKSYVRNAGDAVPYLKRPYRAEVYYDVSEKRHKTRGVPALVPSREFSNLLSTGCGALGQAVTALANARGARARAHVQHPHAALGVLRMNTVVVGHPAGPAARGVVPLDAPGHLAMALHDDVVAAEYAVQQAFHELEGKLAPYEVFRVFPPGDDRRDAVMPTDVDDMFRHAASMEMTRALDRILARVHARSASCWPQQGINPFDTLEALQKHVYALIAPRTQPSAATLDKERRGAEALARQVAEHAERQREARIYREARDAARDAAREADFEAARLARLSRLVART